MPSSLKKLGQASFEPLPSKDDNNPNNNRTNLLATYSGLDCEPVATNEPIKLMNKFDTLLLEEEYEPYEDGGNQDGLTCYDKEDSGYGSTSPPPPPPPKQKNTHRQTHKILPKKLTQCRR